MSNVSLNSSIPTNTTTSSNDNCTFVNEEFLRYVPGLIIVPYLIIASFAAFVAVKIFLKNRHNWEPMHLVTINGLIGNKSINFFTDSYLGLIF